MSVSSLACEKQCKILSGIYMYIYICILLCCIWNTGVATGMVCRRQRQGGIKWVCPASSVRMLCKLKSFLCQLSELSSSADYEQFFGFCFWKVESNNNNKNKVCRLIFSSLLRDFAAFWRVPCVRVWVLM